MAGFGVNIAILKDGKILLTKREDFEVWCLPGGIVEPGESVVEAAVREAREETGLEVGLTRLVEIYSRPNWRDGEHTYDYSEGHCRQVKDPKISMNMGWGTPGIGSALIMRR